MKHLFVSFSLSSHFSDSSTTMKMKKPHQNRNQNHSLLSLLLPLSLTALTIAISPSLAAEFLFNGFNSSDPLLFFGNATIRSNVLTLTNDTTFSMGRVLHATRVAARRRGGDSSSAAAAFPFSTSFIFAMAPYSRTALAGHGLVFLFTPVTGLAGAVAAQNLGFLNRTNDGLPGNHVLGVEFDVFKNEEFSDIDGNHVGVDVNSLKSKVAHEAGFWTDESNGTGERVFRRLDLNSGENYQAWIDYNGSVINVTMVRAGMRRPRFPLLSVAVNLSEVFVDDMYVGFTSSTGQMVQSHKILAWSFSNTNFSLSEGLVTSNLPSFVLPGESVFESEGFIAGVAVGGFALVVAVVVLAMCLVKRRRRIARERAEMEDWELEYWPHRIAYRDIEDATTGFAEENVIGVGGNGKVYRGVLQGGSEIAVKRMSHENDGMREFLAEISSLGRLKHRSLVGLRGWCKRERGVFMLVYDYMENGSLDKRVYYDCDETIMLSFEDRIRILKDVASGVLYLHEGWESKVLHRDIKASNVLLDKEMNGRLGDFGLARMHGHGQVASTTRVVGTVGYLAPEVVRNGRASTQTDVFGFGALILEVMCGRRPIEEGKVPLVELVGQMMLKGQLLDVLDERLRAKWEFDSEEVERVLQLGLLCAYPDPSARPSMRQVVKILEGKGNEVNDVETQDMGTYLLEKVKNDGDFWTGFSHSFGYGSTHPTFDDIKQSLSSSMSLSWSNSIVDGR